MPGSFEEYRKKLLARRWSTRRAFENLLSDLRKELNELEEPKSRLLQRLREDSSELLRWLDAWPLDESEGADLSVTEQQLLGPLGSDPKLSRSKLREAIRERVRSLDGDVGPILLTCMGARLVMLNEASGHYFTQHFYAPLLPIDIRAEAMSIQYFASHHGAAAWVAARGRRQAERSRDYVLRPKAVALRDAFVDPRDRIDGENLALGIRSYIAIPLFADEQVQAPSAVVELFLPVPGVFFDLETRKTSFVRAAEEQVHRHRQALVLAIEAERRAETRPLSLVPAPRSLESRVGTAARKILPDYVGPEDPIHALLACQVDQPVDGRPYEHVQIRRRVLVDPTFTLLDLATRFQRETKNRLLVPERKEPHFTDWLGKEHPEPPQTEGEQFDDLLHRALWFHHAPNDESRVSDLHLPITAGAEVVAVVKLNLAHANAPAQEEVSRANELRDFFTTDASWTLLRQALGAAFHELNHGSSQQGSEQRLSGALRHSLASAVAGSLARAFYRAGPQEPELSFVTMLRAVYTVAGRDLGEIPELLVRTRDALRNAMGSARVALVSVWAYGLRLQGRVQKDSEALLRLLRLDPALARTLEVLAERGRSGEYDLGTYRHLDPTTIVTPALEVPVHVDVKDKLMTVKWHGHQARITWKHFKAPRILAYFPVPRGLTSNIFHERTLQQHAPSFEALAGVNKAPVGATQRVELERWREDFPLLRAATDVLEVAGSTRGGRVAWHAVKLASATTGGSAWLLVATREVPGLDVKLTSALREIAADSHREVSSARSLAIDSLAHDLVNIDPDRLEGATDYINLALLAIRVELVRGRMKVSEIVQRVVDAWNARQPEQVELDMKTPAADFLVAEAAAALIVTLMQLVGNALRDPPVTVSVQLSDDALRVAVGNQLPLPTEYRTFLLGDGDHPQDDGGVHGLMLVRASARRQRWGLDVRTTETSTLITVSIPDRSRESP